MTSQDGAVRAQEAAEAVVREAEEAGVEDEVVEEDGAEQGVAAAVEVGTGLESQGEKADVLSFVVGWTSMYVYSWPLLKLLAPTKSELTLSPGFHILYNVVRCSFRCPSNAIGKSGLFWADCTKKLSGKI